MSHRRKGKKPVRIIDAARSQARTERIADGKLSRKSAGAMGASKAMANRNACRKSNQKDWN